MGPRRGPNLRNPRSTDLGIADHVMRKATSEMSYVIIFITWQLYMIGLFHLVRHLRSRFLCFGLHLSPGQETWGFLNLDFSEVFQSL